MSEKGENRVAPRLAAIVALLVLVLACGWLYSNMWRVTGKGNVWTQAEWPHELRALLKSIPEQARNDTQRTRVYLLDSVVDSSHIWKLECPPTVFELLCKQLNMHKVDKADVPNAFWNMPPAWWNPERNVMSSYAKTPGFTSLERGADGNYAFAMYDEEAKAMYVWSKSNF